MPKVTEKYLMEKRNLIMECTEEVLREKPLYQITMRDIIKKAGFSQGVVYRYYANLDEIYVDFINKHTIHNFLEEKIDLILYSEQSEKIILTECFIVMGEFIEELLGSVAGKTFFELMVLYAHDFEKRAEIFPKLIFKQNLEYAQHKIVAYILKSIEQGIFCPQISVESIIMFASTFIDGIAQSMVINTAESSSDDAEPILDIPEIFQMLAKAIINFLEG